MKKTILLFTTLLTAVVGWAQAELPTQQQTDTLSGNSPHSIFNLPSAFIGYLSYDSALVSMPGYVIVEKQMADLQQAYDAELKRAEEEFNQKYEAFLDGRKDFPRTIMLKRQTELQQLLQRNVDFRQQSMKELAEARRQAMLPLRQQLSQAIAAVARSHQLAIVVNTDADATPFIDPDLSIDLNAEVQQALNR